MLVYGDLTETLSPATVLRDARARLEAGDDPMAAFMAVSRTAQALADRRFALTGEDEGLLGRPGRGDAALADALMALAAAVSDFSDDVAARAVAAAALSSLLADAPDWLGEPLEARLGEGYAFYALYPQAYAAAARQSGLPADTEVIGLRSIGTGLAAVVAAALGAPAPATLRPIGDPFDRRIAPASALAERWLRPGQHPFAVVDEGPGLSGSSFRAVVRWLEDHGVASSRVHLFPSHPGDPGAEADPAWARAWHRTARHHVAVETLLYDEMAGAPLIRALENLLGAPVTIVADIAGGRWRERLCPPPAPWPAADPRQERRKLLVEAGGVLAIARFAGLGETGERKLAMARALASAGFVPQPLGLVRGWLVESFAGDARPAATPADRARVLDRLPLYLAARQHLFAGEALPGASATDLGAMLVRNAELALGPPARAAALRLAATVPQAGPTVAIDGRLDLHEWLIRPDGPVLKADAIDHHAGHDLVGCQPLAWDVAGAEIELALSTGEMERLLGGLAVAGAAVDPAPLVFWRACYAAFRLGADTLAADAAGDPPERYRLERRAAGYAAALERALGEGVPGATQLGVARI